MDIRKNKTTLHTFLSQKGHVGIALSDAFNTTEVVLNHEELLALIELLTLHADMIKPVQVDASEIAFDADLPYIGIEGED